MVYAQTPGIPGFSEQDRRDANAFAWLLAAVRRAVAQNPEIREALRTEEGARRVQRMLSEFRNDT